MLNRTANALYWMARYLERAESTARLIEANLSLSLDLPDEASGTWEAVVETTGDLESFRRRWGTPNPEAVFQFLTFDPENPNSVLETVRSARENARTVRENLPLEAWEAVNLLHLRVRQAAADAGALTHLEDTAAVVRSMGRQLEGILDSGFTREEGWHFVQLGRYCERADQTSRLLDVNHVLMEGRAMDGENPARWEAVLKSASALQMYRRRHGSTEAAKVAEFFLLEEAFPRSLAFCLRQAEESLRALTGTVAGRFQNGAEKTLGKLAADMRYTEFGDVLAAGLHEWLDGFQARLNLVGTMVQKEYFEVPPQGALRAPEVDQPQQ